MSVAVKSRAILPSASRPLRLGSVVQFSAARTNQKQPEELHVTSIIATAMVEIAGNNSPVPLVVRSMVGNQSQSAQNKHSGTVFPVCPSLVSIQSRCGGGAGWKPASTLTPPLFPSIIDPTDPTELQRRRQAFSQSTARRWTWSPHRSGPAVLIRGHDAFVSLFASTDGTVSSGDVPRFQMFSNSPRSQCQLPCVHVYIQIYTLGFTSTIGTRGTHVVLPTRQRHSLLRQPSCGPYLAL